MVTQAIADFLATENIHHFDGIIFDSVQTNDCKNVVLFQHAANVEQIDRADESLLSVRTSEWMDDDIETAYSVLETAEPNARTRERITPVSKPSCKKTEITLRLIQESVFVHHILAVAYADRAYRVQHYLIEPNSEF